MKKQLMIIMLISLLVVSNVQAIGLFQYFTQGASENAPEQAQEAVQENVPSELQDEDMIQADTFNEEAIIELVNKDEEALSIIEETGITSLTVETDVREVNLAFEEGQIVYSEEEGQYTVSITEENIEELWESYQDKGYLTRGEVLRNVTPDWQLFRIAWKVIN